MSWRTRLLGLLQRKRTNHVEPPAASSDPETARVKFVFGDGSAVEVSQGERLEYVTSNLYLRRKTEAH